MIIDSIVAIKTSKCMSASCKNQERKEDRTLCPDCCKVWDMPDGPSEMWIGLEFFSLEQLGLSHLTREDDYGIVASFAIDLYLEMSNPQ